MDIDEGSFQEYNTHCNVITNIAFTNNDKYLITTDTHNLYVWKIINNY